MSGHRVVVVGFSAGGVEPLARLVADLPADFPAPVFVVHHFPAESVSTLPSILRRSGSLPALHPVDGQQIEPGRIYVARPDSHLLIKGDRIQLSRGPRENGHRPAIDALFRTAAKSFGPAVVGVLLSGTLDDGTAGLMAIKGHGGTAVVQDPDDALYQGMPRHAIANVMVDHVLPISEMASLLARVAHESVESPMKEPHSISTVEQGWPDPAEHGTAGLKDNTLKGPPSPLTCPGCAGALWESRDGDLVRYCCHVGHVYTPEGLVAFQAEGVEIALWSALRALQEKVELSRRMADRSRNRGLLRSASQFEAVARDAEHGSAVIRQTLLNGTGEPPVDAQDREALDSVSSQKPDRHPAEQSS